MEGIWVCTSGSDAGRRRGPLGTEPELFLSRTSHLATLQESKGGLADPPAPGRAAEKGFREGAIPSLSLK